MFEGFAERWNANAHLYADDIVTFLEDQWIVREAPRGMELGTDNTIRLVDHQKVILREFFRRDDNGDLVYDEMIYCLAPGARVLRGDLRWVPVESLNVGDALIAFDTDPPSGRGKNRQLRTAEVTRTGRRTADAARLTFDDGTTITASLEHPFLVRRNRTGQNIEWRTTGEIVVGDRLPRMFRTWSEDRTYWGGYIAAALDGEGSVKRNGQQLSFAQRDNEMLEHYVGALEHDGVSYHRYATKGGVFAIRLDKRADVFQVLGTYRPRRLIGKLQVDGTNMHAIEDRIVTAIDPCVSEVVTLSTSTETYFAEGFACHNSTIKKSGKTEIEGGVAEWAGLTFEGIPELYFVANDKEQAQTRGFAAIGAQINDKARIYNPVVRSLFVPPNRFTPSTALMPFAGGGFIKSIPIDYAGEAGSNPLASLWDELWGAERESQRRLWDELTPPPTRRNAFRFVATYAGFKGESDLLWDLYKRIVGDTTAERRKRRIHPDLPLYVNGRSIAYWDEGEAARRMPWQTPEYYATEKAKNRPEMFARIHMNLWQTNATRFIEAAWWDALDRRAFPRTLNESGFPQYVTVDAAHKRDTTFGIVLEFVPVLNHAGRYMFRVVDLAVWRPDPGQRVVIPEDTALPWVREKIATGNVKAVGFDPAHFETPAQRLRDEYPGLDIREITQSQLNLTKMGTALYDAVSYRTLIVPPESDQDEDSLRSHVLNAVAQHTPVGYRIVKGKEANKVDGAVSLSMALMLASERGIRDSETRSPIYVLGIDDDEEDE